MRDKTHIEQVERWAEFVKNNPIEKWKPALNQFIDSQFDMAQRFYKNLEKTEKGMKILERLKDARINRD